MVVINDEVVCGSSEDEDSKSIKIIFAIIPKLLAVLIHIVHISKLIYLLK